MFSELFRQLGFNDKEQLVYLAVVESGKPTAQSISKATQIPRASVYAILESLLHRGVVSVEQMRGSSRYVATNPSAFTRLVEVEREALSAKERAAKALVENLSPFLNQQDISMPKLQFFESRSSIETMLHDYLPEWRRSMERCGDTTLWGYQDNSFVEQYRRWHDYLWRTMPDTEHIRLFSNKSDIEKELSHRIDRREVRPLPEEIVFTSSIWLYGDYIVMAMTSRKPHYAVQLRDPVFAQNLRALFRFLWKAVSGGPIEETARRPNGRRAANA